MSFDRQDKQGEACHFKDITETLPRQKRVFLIVLDSFGIGGQPDAAAFGDEGSNTLAAVATSPYLNAPHLRELGLFSIDGVAEAVRQKRKAQGLKDDFPLPDKNFVPQGAYGRLLASSRGKDTTIGHWELAGIISPEALPVYPQGFPPEIITAFEKATGRKVICNLPYSGTEVIRDFGQEHVETGALIVYTSADSVFQVAAHEDVVPVEQLYRYCDMAREIMTGSHSVGRIIARPFNGTAPNFARTPRRHDVSLLPPHDSLLDRLKANDIDVIAIGKIYDIFAGQGISRWQKTTGNKDGIEKTKAAMNEAFNGLCFVNLVDFDMLYGHRNDIDGYAKAISFFDQVLPGILKALVPGDLLIITADHGCDPSTASTDHSRESVPCLIYGPHLVPGQNFHQRRSFADLAATIATYLDLPEKDRELLEGEPIPLEFM